MGRDHAQRRRSVPPRMKQLMATGTVAPVAAGGLGAIGVWAARNNPDAAPGIVFAALVVAVACSVLHQRGLAVAALGVGAAAAFPSPAGLGPLMVATGAVIATEPTAIDLRLARWPEVIDGLIALPALAGLASVVAAQPSERGLAVGIGTGVLTAVSWWRGPRHGVYEPIDETVVAYLGVVGGSMLAFAPSLFSVFGVLPGASVQAGQGLAAALAVFVLALVVRQLGALRTNAPAPTAAHRR